MQNPNHRQLDVKLFFLLVVRMWLTDEINVFCENESFCITDCQLHANCSHSVIVFFTSSIRARSHSIYRKWSFFPCGRSIRRFHKSCCCRTLLITCGLASSTLQVIQRLFISYRCTFNCATLSAASFRTDITLLLIQISTNAWKNTAVVVMFVTIFLAATNAHVTLVTNSTTTIRRVTVRFE